MRFSEFVDTSSAVASTGGRLEKVAHLAALLARLAPDEVPIAVAFLTGSPRQGRIGIGAAQIRAARDAAPAPAPSLDLHDIDRTFERIAALRGSGSTSARVDALRALFGQATSTEQEWLARLLFGDLRQGALEGVLTDAVARAAAIPAGEIRRRAMFAGDLAPVAVAALTAGRAGLAAFTIEPFRPVQPMLADSAAGVDEALEGFERAAFEHKLDGARIQVHKDAGEVRVFSRTLRDVTAAVPEVVEAARALPAPTLILDGETLALRPGGAPHPFQMTMRRFGRRMDVERLRADLPLTPVFFDVILLDREPLVDEPLERRASLLAEVVPAAMRVPRLVTADRAAAEQFAREAIAGGHEGVMAKALDAPYAAGRRGQAWLKIKRAHTLDLVVLAAEWGSGRRTGLLSNLHLGARDVERGGFVMLGKTFKGLTDEMLAWQTEQLLALELARDAWTVFVRPELVVEIAFNEIQESRQYPGRLALRFARVKRYRDDKPAAEGDTFAQVQQIYRQITGLDPPVRA